MGVIIGILSRMFSGAGIIVLVLLGLVIGALGDVLLAMLYIYGAIVWFLIIFEFIIPLGITISAILIEHIVYPFRWLNNYLLGADKPEFDFLKVKKWSHITPIGYIRSKLKKAKKAKKVPDETISNEVDKPNEEPTLNHESAVCVSEESMVDDFDYEYDSETENYERRKICEHLDFYDSCDDNLINDLEDGLSFEDYDNWDDYDWEEYVENKRRCRSAYY